MDGLKRCLVLGANGFIGGHVCAALLQAGHEVLAFDISREFPTLAPLACQRLRLRTGDFLNRSHVDAALADIDWVFHLVSTTLPGQSNDNMAFDVQSNVVASLELLQACRRHSIEKLVFASSGGTVYGQPAQLPVAESAPQQPLVSYGATKLVIEKYCYLFTHQFGLQSVVLRLANPYGPGHHGLTQGVISVFLKRLLANQAVEVWGDGSIVRDYVYVSDVAQAFVMAAAYRGAQPVFNIGSGAGISLTELLSRLQAMTGCAAEVLHRPGRIFDVPEIVLDVRLAARELGWQPRVSLDEGIRRTWRALITR